MPLPKKDKTRLDYACRSWRLTLFGHVDCEDPSGTFESFVANRTGCQYLFGEEYCPVTGRQITEALFYADHSVTRKTLNNTFGAHQTFTPFRGKIVNQKLCEAAHDNYMTNISGLAVTE